MHKTIFTWFDNLPTFTELQGFHYYQEEYKVRLQYFLSLKHGHHKTLITQLRFLHNCSATHPPVLKLEDQLKLRITLTSQ